MFTIGVDVGSTYTKYCVMQGGEIEKLFCEKTPVRQREYFRTRSRELLLEYPGAKIVSCGYGKGNIETVKCVHELTALSKGAFRMCPESALVLDIGGQDTKIIQQEEGSLKGFFINDKCAAGSGIFLTNVLSILDRTFESIDLTGAGEPKAHLSAVCAVFAQSEIVELLARDFLDVDEIIKAAIWQILRKAKPLLEKVPEGGILLSGGLCEIRGISEFARLALSRNICVNERSRYLSAIGAAMD